MIQVDQTAQFAAWLSVLSDPRARGRILVRIRRFSLGNPGDISPVGNGVAEMRIDYGPGYRVYLTRRGARRAVLLCGGDKSTQERDIRLAKRLAKLL